MPGDTSNPRQAASTDWPAIRALLQRAGLPTEDLDAHRLQDFLIMQAHDLLAVIGLQRFDGIGLVRSLVVTESHRNKGLARRLLHALEARAASAGIRELWLLTIDAQSFFLRHGYRVEPRASVPQIIAQTAEFRSLCPGTAHLMRKDLNETA
jgi:N-acetylglutamate synthase-like GNAT family acetyltransferase